MKNKMNGKNQEPAQESLPASPGATKMILRRHYRRLQPARQTMALEIPSEKAEAPRRILLVDDDIHQLELNTVALVRFGYDVDMAEDGAAAWNALHDDKVSYDLLITDNTMPRVTGLELIKKLRAEEMNLPIVMASGTVPAEELKRHPWLRVAATLPKPFTVAELLYTVNKVLGATKRAAGSSRLFRDYATLDVKIPQVEKSAQRPIPGQIKKAYRVLVAEGDSDIRQLSVDVLAGSGYDVEGVPDGAAGWEAFVAGKNYDLVVTDNIMPKMTGIEMIEKLRSARIKVPVIMATEHLPLHEFARKPWLKPEATLQRPFSNDILLETVKKVLDSDGDASAEIKMVL
jgi:DNA-binding response OmpR family regulator